MAFKVHTMIQNFWLSFSSISRELTNEFKGDSYLAFPKDVDIQKFSEIQNPINRTPDIASNVQFCVMVVNLTQYKIQDVFVSLILINI